MTQAGAGVTGPAVTVVVPTFNEAGNVAELLGRLAAALDTVPAEVVFVDDSTDSTPEVIAAAACSSALPVRLLRRATPTGGLGGAVVEGLRTARAPWAVVMDADLQHPPALVPELVAAGRRTGADLVVASRYAAGGDRAGLAGAYRTAVSGLTTVLAKGVFRRELAGITDPMSGFFAVRPAALDLDGLRPLGYKVLLELAVRCRPAPVVEVPYTFAERFAGESKSSLREGFRFLRHVLVLRSSAVPDRAAPILAREAS